MAEEPQWAKLAKMNPGEKMDFQVRVHVIEARDLQPRDKNGMSDPVCFVRIGDQKKNTPVQKKTLSCTWDYLMFFELKMTADEFFHDKITIKVMDANTVLRDVEIGGYEFDASYIYEQKNHEIYRKWVALTYRDEDNAKIKTTGVQGYLKLSICVLGPKDSAPAHDDKEELDDDEGGADLQSMVLMPPDVKTQDYSLEVCLYKAEGLPKMDAFGTCDGYVGVKYGGSKEMVTEVVKNTFTPQWLEKISLPFQTPTMSDVIRLQVRDWDKGAVQDDIVGTAYLRLNEIMNGKVNWKLPRWINLYGCPEGTTTTGLTPEVQLAQKMLNGHVEGTAFRGRVLLSANTVQAMDPKPAKLKVNAPNEPATAGYILRFDLYEAAELQSSSDVTIEVSMGLAVKESKKAKVQNGHATWYQSFDDTAMPLPVDRTQIPDIFINIYKNPPLIGKKRVGYIRLSPNDVTAELTPRWMIATPDLFSDADKSQAAGFVNFAVALAPATEYKGQRQQISKPNLEKYVLRAHIYQGKELPSGDSEGSSDAYCIVRIGKHSARTKTIKETIFPIWYESLVIPCELPQGLVNAADIHVMVYDWDQVGSDDFLGRFSVPISQVSEQMPENPKWYPIYAKDPSMPEGEILASFQLLPESKASSVPMPSITPKFKDCILEASVVGLREIVPYDLLPVNKTSVELDCGTPTTKGKTKGSTKPSTLNPNYLENITINVPVPENKLFAPPINIKVRDDRLIHQPLVATRSISMTPFIPWAPEEVVVREDITPVVDKIPGAKDEPEKPVATPEVSIQVVDNEEEEKLKLLQNANQDISTIHDDLVSAISQSGLSVQESFLKGAEAEAEEEKDKRETIKAELESTLKKPPFAIYKLYRAKKKNGRPYRVDAGEYKGQFKLYEAKNKDKESPLDLSTLYKPTPYVVRVYILEGFQLVPKDADGNNPYLKISLGKTKIKDMDTAKQTTSRPQFFKCYEIPCTFPDETILNIECWDWDPTPPDDLIGSTRIDLETRFYSEEWKAMKHKPIEFRTLWNPTSSNPQGQLKMWIDILTPEEARANPPEPISPPAPIEYELRVIVWNTRNVKVQDDGGKRGDILVAGFPDGQTPQTTDTHWNSKDGTGMFNWRLKFPIKVPLPNPRFKLQVWDRNMLTANGAVCEANLNLRSFYMKAYKNKLLTNELPQQWITLTHPNAQGPQGEVSVSFELLTLDEARKRPAGFGREEPNDNPTLPEPNRPADSLAPWRVDKKAILALGNFWAAHKWKIYGAIGCVICTIVLIIILYVASIF